jgi:uncharacterized protein YPO0396
MLEPFDVKPRIDALIGHFDDLSRAHEAVLKAKRQIDLLSPLVADCERHAELAAAADQLRTCREALRPWFAGLKLELLEKRLVNLNEELSRFNTRIERLEEQRRSLQVHERDLRRTISEKGGDRIERIGDQIRQQQEEQQRRRDKADRFENLLREVGLSPGEGEDAFIALNRRCAALREQAEQHETRIQNELNEAGVAFARGRDEREQLVAEITGLKTRQSNIDERQVAMRRMICAEIDLSEEEMPFAGELIQVREEERDWEGAIERMLHGFGLSMLVPDRCYPAVAEYVDSTHLKGRLVYFRVRPSARRDLPELHPDSLARKLQLKPDTPFYDWIEREVAHRFDLACCSSQEQFRREMRAITVAGQIKAPGERHEKDDRHRIDDRRRYVLGWSNAEKIAALERQARRMEERLGESGDRIASLQKEQNEVRSRLTTLTRIGEYREFRELDWRPLTVEIAGLVDEKKRLEAASDILQTLAEQLAKVEEDLTNKEEELQRQRDLRSRIVQRKSDAEDLQEQTRQLAEGTDSIHGAQFKRLAELRVEALGEHRLSVESCDNREREMRDWLQAKIDAEDKKIVRLRDRIIDAMRSYSTQYPLDTQEVDVSMDAAGEYRTMLDQLIADDLPRFEARFKELLNENTIREVANFQSQLARERETIRERIERINESLAQIDYNPGRYIVLEAQTGTDADIRDFHSELRTCTEGALTGSDGDQYSEAKFLQVRRIIERFRGRDGQSDLDRRWTAKVTDVRNWFVFAASERWREDGSEYEHYADSGGKSGGQKEKLAYTVLAASLAYQFGLEWGEVRSRSFRFVVIDEAFGRGSDESAQYGLRLFEQLNLQLLIVTPLQKIHIIEPFVAAVGFVHSEDGKTASLRNLTIEEYREEKQRQRS